MCGIVGKLALDPPAPVAPELVSRMLATIRHRGPDDEGAYINGPVALGGCRLAIIDLSPHGHQPMTNEDASIWMVFNGEIYNFQELKADLEARGHRFRSRCDSEVVIHLYEEFGVNCLGHLRGMYAFAIWDTRDRSLFLARDRLGKKPLHYYHDGKVFLFASEPKAILLDPDVRTAPDPEAIHYYLTYGYVPSPLSAFRGFQKLAPAHYLLLRNGAARVERYWRLHYGRKGARTEPELCEEIRERLREAVRLRMVSDVPLGALLSGGIDSSAIVAMMSELGGGPVKTFSIGFEEQDYDELKYARLVAQRFGTDHHECIVKPDGIEMLSHLVWYYNEPYADSSALPTFYLSKLARLHVTVALSGDGGDENFAGYLRYVTIRRSQQLHRLPWWVKRSLAAASRVVPNSLSPRHILQRGKRFVTDLNQGPCYRYARFLSYFADLLKADLYTPEFRACTSTLDSLDPLLDALKSSDAPDLLEAALDADVSLYLPDDLLVKMDIASMANSLEVRSPLLDHRFMEFVATIPSHQKVHRGVTKYIFRKSLEGILPREVIHRGKMGFEVPIKHWFRNELRGLAIEVLLDRCAIRRGYFRPETIRRLIDEHAAGAALWHHQLWNLLMLELWHRMFIDRTIAPPSLY